MAPDLGANAVRRVDSQSDVAVVRWPDQQAELDRLTRLGIPRLLLVDPGDLPPTCTSCLEDWIRFPADDVDINARLRALIEHQRAHTRPTVDEYGILRHDRALVFLSPRAQQLADILIANFGAVVRDEVIEAHVFSDSDEHTGAVRIYVSRLRKQVASLGLTISCIRNVGYVMHYTSAISGPQHNTE